MIALIKVVKEVVHYVYNIIIVRQLLVILTSEFLRLKRLALKAINKSRRLRVIDSNDRVERIQNNQ